uniref:Citrate transporter-like domain-containing protein n=1 Tax=Ciona savignyi TaxID=51511 RepID=H2Y7R5_CIOSA
TMNARNLMSLAWTYRNTLIIVLTPLILLPLLLAEQSLVAKCAYGLIIMAVYWTTEACPLAVTSLLPIVLFPMLGVLDADSVSMAYTRQLNFLFMGGLMVAVAIEEWNLHRRIALKILMLIGARPCWVLLGFMMVTALLSMWISNTATTAMMVPIAVAVYDQMSDVTTVKTKNPEEVDEEAGLNGPTHKWCSEVQDQTDTQNVTNNRNDEVVDPSACVSDVHTTHSKEKNLRKAMLLCVSYAANIGGFATLIGTPANLILPGALDSVCGSSETVDFVSWMAFSVPVSLVCLLLTWIWLQIRFIGIRLSLKGDKRKDNRVKAYIVDSYNKLGPVTFGELAVLGHFVVLAILWLTRDPKFVSGWKEIFPRGLMKDSTSAILVSFSLFVFPSKNPFRKLKGTNEVRVSSPPLLAWKTAQKNVAWDVFFLLGAGFALAKACEDSGLTEWVGDTMSGLTDMSPAAFALIISIMLSLLTEFTSNVSTASIFLPVLCRLASHSGIHPLYIAIPATISCSFAFSLPVATPPNAIAFSYGGLKVKDLISTGLVLNFICVFILNGFLNLTGVPIFNLSE